MKLSRIFISILISVLLFVFSIDLYDLIIKDKYYENTESYFETDLFIDYDINNDGIDLISTLTKAADETGITIHIPTGSIDDIIHYIHTNDPNIINSFILEGGEKIDFLSENLYSSLSDSEVFRIFKPTNRGSITVIPLKASDLLDFNIWGEYQIISESWDNINSFKEVVSTELGMLNLTFTDVYLDDDHTEIEYNSKLESTHFYLLLSLETLLALTIVLNVTRNTKKIMILRLEGESTCSIFRKMIGKDIIYLFFVIPFLILFLSILFFSIYKSIFTHTDLFIILFKYLTYLKIIDFIFLVLYFWIFSRIKINEGIKGRNNSKLISSSLYLLKLLFIIISLVPFIDGFKTLIIAYESEIYYYETEEYMKNRYVTEGVYAGDVKNDLGKEHFLHLIRDELFENHNGFIYYDFILEDYNIETKNELTKQIVVSQSYFEFLEIDQIISNTVISSDLEYCKNFGQNQSELNCIFDDSLFTKLISFSPHITEDFPIKGYYPNYGHVNNSYIVFESIEENSFGRVIFEHSGDVDSAQNLLDSLFIKYEIKPMYKVKSLDSLVKQDRSTMLFYFFISFLNIITFITSYVILSKVSIEVEFLEKSDRYYLEIVEGKTQISFLIRNVVEYSPLYFLIIVISFIFGISTLLIFVIVMLLLLVDNCLFLALLKK